MWTTNKVVLYWSGYPALLTTALWSGSRINPTFTCLVSTNPAFTWLVSTNPAFTWLVSDPEEPMMPLSELMLSGRWLSCFRDAVGCGSEFWKGNELTGSNWFYSLTAGQSRAEIKVQPSDSHKLLKIVSEMIASKQSDKSKLSHDSWPGECSWPDVVREICLAICLLVRLQICLHVCLSHDRCIYYLVSGVVRGRFARRHSSIMESGLRLSGLVAAFVWGNGHFAVAGHGAGRRDRVQTEKEKGLYAPFKTVWNVYANDQTDYD